MTIDIQSVTKEKCFRYKYLRLSLTSTLANLSVASPEDSDKGGSVMSSGPDVVILSEEDVVTVLHTAETTNKETESETKQARK